MYQSQLQAFHNIHAMRQKQYAEQLQQHMQQIQLQQQQLQKIPLYYNNVAPSQNSICTLPDLIEYAIGKDKIVFHLKDKVKSKIEEETPLCKYYNLLDNAIKERKITDKEQFKRVKIIMHDMVENEKMETIDKRIDAEANYEPLKSLLSAKQGGFIRKKQTRRLRRKNKTHKR